MGGGKQETGLGSGSLRLFGLVLEAALNNIDPLVFRCFNTGVIIVRSIYCRFTM